MNAETARRLHLEAPLSPDQTHDLMEEMRVSHCGHLPEAMLAPMALAQRARDATMAVVMNDMVTPVVLIAGDGHARTDRGVPAHLRALSPNARIVSVAFVEVQADVRAPGSAPYDYVWYTPRASDEDPCAGL
jgi:uncharacterized iron-regulated protein